uniref:hypothetical protein n=2 Tax=Flavobacterium sp. TaxID=239 RepID=UPI00404A11C8
MLLFHNSNSQTIQGIVSDSTGTIPFSTILLKRKSNPSLINQFTTSDENGFYKIITKNPIDSILIEVTSPSHKTKILNLNTKTYTGNPITINLSLEIKEIELNEIILSDKRAIYEKKDTVFYNPDKFRDGSEKVVEDILKKLPGITISEDGKISFKGKEIKKMLLDGDDLFDQNYVMGSKNINADMIEEIQGIDDYHNNDMLKGVTTSEDVALNLILKKGKTDISGTLTLSGSFEDRYENNLNCILTNNKIKAFGNISYNNLGLNHPIYTNGEFSNNRSLSNQLSKNIISTGNYTNANSTIFNEVFNNNIQANLYSLNKIYKKSSLKYSFNFYQDNLQNTSSSTTNIVANEDIINILQSSTISKKPNIYEISYHFTQKENKNFYIENKGVLAFDNYSTVETSSNNLILQENKINKKSYFVNQVINMSHKTKDSLVGLYELNISKNKSPQILNIAPGTLIEEAIISFSQESEFDKNYFFFNSSLFKKKDKMTFFLNTNTLHIDNRFYSSIKNENNESLGVEFENIMKYQITSLNFKPKITLFLKNWAFLFELNASQNNLFYENQIKNETNKKNEILLMPQFKLGRRFNKNSNLIFNYNFNQIIPEEDNMFEGLVQSNFRNFNSNIINLEFLKTHNFNLSYKYYNFYSQTSFLASLIYNHRENNYFTRNIISDDISIFKKFYAPLGTNDYKLLLNSSIPSIFLKSTFILSTSYSLIYEKNVVNASEIRNSIGKSINLNFITRTKFSKNLNWYNEINYFDNQFLIKDIKLKNQFSSVMGSSKFLVGKVGSTFNASAKIIFLKNDLQEKEHFYFLETGINYKPKKLNKLSFSLTGRNLTNNKTLINRYISDFSSSTSSVKILSRFILFQTSLNF